MTATVLLDDQPLDGIEVVELRFWKAGDLGLEQRLESLLARCRHGRERAAVEAADEGDDLMRAALVQRAEFARELDRALIGFGAGIGEEHLVEAAVGDQRLGELQAGPVEEGGARRQQQFCLRGQRVGNDRGRMAEAIDGPALHEIEIALAAVVPQVGAFALDEDGGRPRGDVHQRVERMGGVGHVELLCGFGGKCGPKRKKAALFGCGLLENVAELVNQRCRRTRRNPSSSLERRRKDARRLVRFRIMVQAHTAEGPVMSSGWCANQSMP